MNVFDEFINGKLILPEKTVNFAAIEWTKHPSYPGVELKHILTGKDTNNQFSFHLVRIAPNKEIGLHIHNPQLETHEIIGGSGTCLNNQTTLNYFPGIISIFSANTEHKVMAGPDGLYLFAKFFPALC